MDESKSSQWMIALVAIVAVVSIVTMTFMGRGSSMHVVSPVGGARSIGGQAYWEDGYDFESRQEYGGYDYSRPIAEDKRDWSDAGYGGGDSYGAAGNNSSGGCYWQEQCAGWWGGECLNATQIWVCD